MSDKLEPILSQALAGMNAGPRPLMKAIDFYAEQAGTGDSVRELPKRIGAGPNDEVRKLLNDRLSIWDHEGNAAWTGATTPNTIARRNRIYDLLCVDGHLREILQKHLPPYQGAKATVIEDPKSLQDWYTLDFRRKHSFYWKQLRAFLVRQGKIGLDGINSIDASADRVIERLANPASADIYKARGLVVGHVQSGKTTNFTAVIAKAIDAGYRLIIVLSGTTNLLRNQTQRRLDMQLVGRENILRGTSETDVGHDYLEDEGWPHKFISYGKLPSLLGHVDIHRLTSLDDFQQRDAGLNPLEFEFEKRDRRLPLYDRENLDHAGARIAIVKKQRERLRALKAELQNVGKEKCAEVPTLIIDDESDQASVNTVNPKAVDRKRSVINEYIVEILKLLPRANYLGYTATPFANVFINPKDSQDIYPRSFIISLPRPGGYMGAREFIDFEPVKPGHLSNEKAFIRNIPAENKPNDDRLQEAMDTFVLTGAIKKYRASKDGLEFKHHTMLVHHSVSKDDHHALVSKIETLWKKGGYDSPSSYAPRLQKLLDEDIWPVWRDRGQSQGLRIPKSLSELRPYLGAALDEIRKGSSPVLMVNSAEGAEVPDFDGHTGVWKIIVGGTKLSRGYTIEGLTVSYFRRRSKMQDTLMQMGRWFGYRPGFSDLVRLYIGRSEPVSKAGRATIDLYHAFATMCRDEEDFRAQLAMYEGKGGITPLEVPALVYNSHPRLRPTARGKMYYAKITWAAFDYREPTSQAATSAGRTSNEQMFSEFISRRKIETVQAAASGTRPPGITYKWAEATHDEIVSLLVGTRWDKTDNPIAAEIEFLRRKLAPVDSWLFLAPQILQGEAYPWKAGKEEFACASRARLTSSSRFGVYSDPKHLAFAKWLVGAEGDYASPLAPRKRTGVFLFYPTREKPAKRKDVPVMGFGIVIPRAIGPGQRIAYSVDPVGIAPIAGAT